MNNTYCSHCGKKNEYTISKPKFCGGCGEDLSSLVAKKTIVRDEVSAVRPPLHERPAPLYGEGNRDEEERGGGGRDSVRGSARRLAQTIKKSDFIISSSSNSVKAGSILQSVWEAAQEDEQK